MLKHFALIIGAALIICNANAVSAEDAPTDTVVAKVGATEITVGHMIAMARSLAANGAAPQQETLFESVLERLIQQEALAQTLQSISPQTQMQLENERRSLLASDAVEALSGGIVVPETAIQAAYDARFADYQPNLEYNASHIVVDTEAEARTLIVDLENGIAFDELARLKSRGPSGPSGGALGWFGPGRMLPAFQKAVEAMEVGTISEPVLTEAGWHIIKLHDTNLPAAPSLEDVREELEQELRQDLFQQAFADIIRNADVTRTDKSLLDPALLGGQGLLHQN